MEYWIWWAGLNRKYASSSMILSSQRNWGGKSHKLTEGTQVWSGWLSSQLNKDIETNFLDCSVQQSLHRVRAIQLSHFLPPKACIEKRKGKRKKTVIPVGAVLFPSVLTESNVLLLESLGLSFAYCILTLLLLVLFILEDQLIVHASTWWNRVRTVC